MSEQTTPLGGIRVIDFTQVMLGPCATQMLGDFGADVIKIERPGAGDLSRNFFGEQSEEAMNNAVFASLNRNKRSVTIDTKSTEGRQQVLDLVRTADVVTDNFRAGVMDRLGFGYKALSKINSQKYVDIDQSTYHLCVRYGLWPHWSLCPQGRAGCAGAGHVGRNGKDARSIDPEVDLPDYLVRLFRRNASGSGHSRRFVDARKDGARPASCRVAL